MKNTRSVFQLLLVMFLCLSSLVCSTSAVPTSRVLKSFKAIPALQDFQTQEAIEKEMLVVEGRMDFESADYPGTGANNRHDPKTPGTV
ncbi:hypothetical protein DCAR_0417538 [Daucus carota subsp. sativus]|uniref:Uncharacterized protein n=1 Tax=Daucus carota subsp. sativus TaxID=79200 RepID=A0A165YJP6_DAUCS|nr:PREDICTED: uncharacterized protein LOC108216556 [Daucus carota subsp. sativus]WOG98197.1 hypothetical protein DCAR_0417538 [Daucus carota subsp. sativus]